VEIVRRGAWNVCKLLALSASLCEMKGVSPECWLVVVSVHHFGGKGASPGVKTTDPFMKFSHDVVCLLVIQSFEQGCCQPFFE